MASAAPASPPPPAPAAIEAPPRPGFLVRWLLAVAGLLVAGQWLLLLFIWPSLPAEVPTRFGFSGHPTQYGPSLTILLLPLASMLLLALMVVIPRRPDLVRVPGGKPGPTAADHARQVVLGQRCGVALLAFAILVLTYLTWEIARVAQGNATGLGVAFLPVVLLGFVALGGVWIWRSRRPAPPPGDPTLAH